MKALTNRLKLGVLGVLALGLSGLATIPGSAVSTTSDLGPNEAIKVDVQKIAPATPSDSHKACGGACPPYC